MWHVYMYIVYMTYDMREQSLTDGFSAAAGHRWHLHTGYFTTLYTLLYSLNHILHTIYCMLHTVSILYTFHHTLQTLVPIDICNTSPPRFLCAPCTQPLMAPMMADWLLSLLRRCTNLWLMTLRRNSKYWITSHHHTRLKTPVLWRRGKLLWGGAF